MMPHHNARVLTRGAAADQARAGLIMLHGRGASAESILDLAELLHTEDVAVRAPQAQGSVWYPQSFMADRSVNQESIDGAFALITGLIEELTRAGIPRERIMLIGFSQGACLSTDYVYHHPARYGAVFALSGGLIGPPGTVWETRAGLDGTPVFTGCSDEDPFIPADRVRETHEVLERCGAAGTMKLYPGMPHTVNEDEIEHINETIREVLRT